MKEKDKIKEQLKRIFFYQKYSLLLSASIITLIVYLLIYGEVFEKVIDFVQKKENWENNKFIILPLIFLLVFSLLSLLRPKKKRPEKEQPNDHNYLEASGTMFLVINDDQKVSHVNKKGCEILGYEHKEIIGKNWFDDFVSEQFKDEAKTIFFKIIGGETEPYEYVEHHVVTKSKEEKIIAWHNTVLRNERGTIISVLGSGEDITERKEAEEELRYSEKRYGELYEASRDGIAIADLDGRVDSCNFTFLQMHGYILEDLKRLTLWDLMPDKSPEWSKTEIVENQLLQRGYSDLHEKEAVREDGSTFTQEVRLYLIKDKHGKPSGMWVNVRDISERKLTEEQIKASLKEKVLLLKEIHHRVKNNMQVISSLLLLQSLSVEDKKSVEIFQRCQDRIKSMALIHDKLYQTEELANIDFQEYTEELAHTLFDSYKKDDNNVFLKIDVENIFLDIDTAVPLGLIINELVTNALKHAFQNGEDGKLSVTLREIDEEHLELKVCDNGIGLPENIDLKHPENLGLQIVSLLAENQLKGKINLIKNNGTEFQISLQKAKYAKRV